MQLLANWSKFCGVMPLALIHHLLCCSYPVDSTTVMNAVTFLHKAGVAVFFQQSCPNWVVIRPRFVTDLTKAIMNAGKTKHKWDDDQYLPKQSREQYIQTLRLDGVLNVRLLPYLWGAGGLTEGVQPSSLVRLFLHTGVFLDITHKKDLQEHGERTQRALDEHPIWTAQDENNVCADGDDDCLWKHVMVLRFREFRDKDQAVKLLKAAEATDKQRRKLSLVMERRSLSRVPVPLPPPSPPLRTKSRATRNSADNDRYLCPRLLLVPALLRSSNSRAIRNEVTTWYRMPPYTHTLAAVRFRFKVAGFVPAALMVSVFRICLPKLVKLNRSGPRHIWKNGASFCNSTGGTDSEDKWKIFLRLHELREAASMTTWSLLDVAVMRPHAEEDSDRQETMLKALSELVKDVEHILNNVLRSPLQYLCHVLSPPGLLDEGLSWGLSQCTPHPALVAERADGFSLSLVAKAQTNPDVVLRCFASGHTIDPADLLPVASRAIPSGYFPGDETKTEGFEAKTETVNAKNVTVEAKTPPEGKTAHPEDKSPHPEGNGSPGGFTWTDLRALAAKAPVKEMYSQSKHNHSKASDEQQMSKKSAKAANVGTLAAKPDSQSPSAAPAAAHPFKPVSGRPRSKAVVKSRSADGASAASASAMIMDPQNLLKRKLALAKGNGTAPPPTPPRILPMNTPIGSIPKYWQWPTEQPHGEYRPPAYWTGDPTTTQWMDVTSEMKDNLQLLVDKITKEKLVGTCRMNVLRGCVVLVMAWVMYAICVCNMLLNLSLSHTHPRLRTHSPLSPLPSPFRPSSLFRTSIMPLSPLHAICPQRPLAHPAGRKVKDTVYGKSEGQAPYWHYLIHTVSNHPHSHCKQLSTFTL